MCVLIHYVPTKHIKGFYIMNKILRRPEILNRTGLCRTTIYKLIAQNNFPKPVKLGTRAVGWLESDINEWIESRSIVQNKIDQSNT